MKFYRACPQHCEKCCKGYTIGAIQASDLYVREFVWEPVQEWEQKHKQEHERVCEQEHEWEQEQEHKDEHVENMNMNTNGT